MRIFNEEKTIELFNPNTERGYLYKDKLLKEHHEAIPEKIITPVEQIAEQLKTKGKEVNLRRFPNEKGEIKEGYYVVTKIHYRNGKRIGNDEEEVNPIKEEGKKAWDEYEDIQVYHPFTDEEYLDYLRREREKVCFTVINRGAAWYERLTPEQNEELQTWYQAWLDVTDTKVKPATPNWI